MIDSDLLLRNMQRVPALRKTHAKISMIFSALSFIDGVCSGNIDAIGVVMGTFQNLRKNAVYIAAGMEILGAVPEGADAEKSINETLDVVGDKIDGVMSVIKNAISSVQEYVSIISDRIQIAIRSATEYVNEVEATIKSTITKYTSELINAWHSIQCTIAKIQNEISNAINTITMLPSIAVENVITEIKQTVDPTGKKFRATSALLAPVVDQFSSSITESMTASLAGITGSFAGALDKFNRVMDIISEYMGEADGYLLRCGD